MKMKTIASKFNLLTIFLIMLTTLAAGSYVIWRHQINTFENFTQHGEEVAVMLAKNMEYGVYTENQQAISQSLQGLSENPDIAYLVVFNKEKKVLIQRNFLELPQLPSFPGHIATLENKKVVIDDYLEPKHNKSYINIVTPVYMLAETGIDDFDMDFTGLNNQQNNPELIGYLQLGINQDRIYEDSTQFMLQTLLIIPLIAIFGILLTLWQTKRITRPINKLLLATQAISNGEFGEQLTPSSKDEVAELTVAFNGMSKDLAHYKAEVSKHRETLEEEVAQRTHDLQQKTNEAYQLADKAKAASKAKSEFLATMSHEIRTPMNGVLGMTELLLNTEMSGRQKRLADTAYRSAESLLGIINNILDFSKIESGKFQLIINDFDLRQLLEETTEILASQAHNKGLELVLNLPVDLHGIVQSDAERLRQILVNLLGNAIKFTQEGEVQLKVSWAEQSKSDTHMHLLFEVSDTGSGIASEQQATIFESFTQADGSITRRHGGTGLGLSISKQLVEMMGGELKLTSTLGQGSCFYFSLCFERNAQLALNKADISTLQGVNILVVDDNATNREILSEQLTHWGVHCYCAASGIQAINYLLDQKNQNKSYQVALLDWHMPEMDGLTLAKLLRDEPLLQPLSLVMLSSDSVTFDHEQGKQYGISYFLNKPVIQQRLLNCLLELIGSFPSSSQNQAKTNPSKVSNLTGKILLAEDNPVNQEVGMGILRAIGCQVKVVNNGLEAIQATADTHYDAILMDCHMPEMDGFQATTNIRERENTQNAQSHIPIIALTADVQKGIVEKCLDAGMDDYLSKPFNKKQLQEKLEKWLPLNHKEIEKTPTTQTTSDTKPSISNILNPDTLDNLRQLTTESGESLLNKAIKLFVDSAPKEIDALQHALDHQDSSALTKIAHSFKSACANLGAQTLADCAASLESIGKQGHTQGADALLKTMKSDLLVILTALDKEQDAPSVAINNEPATEVQTVDIRSSTMVAPLPTAVNDEATTQIQASAQNKRILLVDDDPSFRMVTSAVLTASAFIVDEADNGLQAVEKVKQQKPDLVLLDAVMDEPDGFETCRLLRAESNMTNVPIVMSTGLGDIDSINSAFDCGATDFMIKPLNYPILIHRLWFILRAEQNSAELRSSKRQLISAQRIARLGYWIWDVTCDHCNYSA